MEPHEFKNNRAELTNHFLTQHYSNYKLRSSLTNEVEVKRFKKQESSLEQLKLNFKDFSDRQYLLIDKEQTENNTFIFSKYINKILPELRDF